MMYIINIFVTCLVAVQAEPIGKITTTETLREAAELLYRNETATPRPQHRRTLRGRPVGDTRPYMVYLRGSPAADPKILETNWLCGGVIIHKQYILTSAACIEDAKHFYVISGTHKWTPSGETNDCISNGAKKAVWKCVPKAYYFDGDDFDNIRWMVGDIAIVKVEDDFNFERRVRGCDFIPKLVDFNNRSRDLEKGGNTGSIAGWGSTESFGDIINRPAINSQDLLETDVRLISKKACKRRWDSRYHFVIEDHMVCTKDSTDDDTMSAICAEHEVNCKEMVYSQEEDYEVEDGRRRLVIETNELIVDTAAHIDSRRKGHRVPSGGFCENDHGGPLILGQGKSSMVIGVMSACLTKEITHKCYGPFLYTSVYKYRNLITCAIEKDNKPTCRTLLRTSKTPMSETTFDWTGVSDGKAKGDKSAKGKLGTGAKAFASHPLLIPRSVSNTSKSDVIQGLFS